MVVATKCGRRVAQDPANYTAGALRQWAERSRENLGLSTIPLTQLHCPPDAVYENDAVFDALDEMVSDGILGAYGVSVETVAQGLRAIERPGVATVQVIFNAFRLKPLERLLPACAKADVGVIVRVPLASGLLSGKYTESTTFPPGDHRTYNRAGRGLRHRRDLLGRALRSRGPGRQAAGQVGRARGLDAARGGAALVRRRARRVHGHTGRPQPRAGPGQCRRRGAGPACPTKSAALVRATYDEEVRELRPRPLVAPGRA